MVSLIPHRENRQEVDTIRAAQRPMQPLPHNDAPPLPPKVCTVHNQHSICEFVQNIAHFVTFNIIKCSYALTLELDLLVFHHFHCC